MTTTFYYPSLTLGKLFMGLDDRTGPFSSIPSCLRVLVTLDYNGSSSEPRDITKIIKDNLQTAN